MSRYSYKLNTFTFLAAMIFTSSTYSLTELNEEELGTISGQASLFDIDKYNFDGNNFYQIKVNSVIQTSINIDRLTLLDSSGDPDIDIEDLSFSGGQSGQVSSTTITNPFIEFAFAGDMNASDVQNREIIGIRLGADNLDGVLSFGQQDPSNPDLDTGINVFSGYMRTNPLSGTANTNALNNVGPFRLQAAVRITGINSVMTMDNARITVPAISAPFTAQPVVVNGKKITQQTITTDVINVAPFNYDTNGSGPVSIPTPFGGSIDLTGYLESANGVMSGLRMIGNVNQDLKTIHQTSVNEGFYISAQNRAVNWRGSEDDDVAQQGWWMGFNGPVQIDPLTLESVDLPNDTLQEILDRASTYLLANPIELGIFDAVAALGPPGVTVDNVDVNLSAASPAPLALDNQYLGASQEPVINCWNGVIGC